MSKQLFRSGTSKGKNAQSRADFNSKMNIALKEATESGFWIDLLHKTEYLDETQYKSLYNDWNKTCYSMWMKYYYYSKNYTNNSIY